MFQLENPTAPGAILKIVVADFRIKLHIIFLTRHLQAGDPSSFEILAFFLFLFPDERLVSGKREIKEGTQ
jgi:hypothetical protein